MRAFCICLVLTLVSVFCGREAARLFEGDRWVAGSALASSRSITRTAPGVSSGTKTHRKTSRSAMARQRQQARPNLSWRSRIKRRRCSRSFRLPTTKMLLDASGAKEELRQYSRDSKMRPNQTMEPTANRPYAQISLVMNASHSSRGGSSCLVRHD